MGCSDSQLQDIHIATQDILFLKSLFFRYFQRLSFHLWLGHLPSVKHLAWSMSLSYH